MAKNQRVNGSLVASKTVPLRTLHWYWQLEHCQYCRPSRRNVVRACIDPPAGQMKPDGQRSEISACSHCASVQQRLMNYGNDRPLWN
jgi:hypothetical protein